MMPANKGVFLNIWNEIILRSLARTGYLFRPLWGITALFFLTCGSFESQSSLKAI